MSSQKKIEANRANGRKGTGPRNPSHSRLNATKHNLFSRELRLTPEEQTEFAAIQAALREDLHPHGFILEQACDDLAVIYWRLRLATRIEQQHVAGILAAQAAEGKPGVPMSEQRNPREALAVLDALEQHARRSVAIPDSLTQTASETLGPEFVRYLREWQPVNPCHMLIAGLMVQKSELFNLPLHWPPPTPEQEEALKTMVSQTCREAQLKLLALKRLELQAGLPQAGAVDPERTDSPRARLETYSHYIANLRRDLQRALHFYFSLRADLAAEE